MSEEEIIKKANLIIENHREIDKMMVIEMVDLIQGLLDLYNKEKEKIEELEKLQENNRKELEQAINFLNFKQINKISDKIFINMSVRDILKQLLEGDDK